MLKIFASAILLTFLIGISAYAQDTGKKPPQGDKTQSEPPKKDGGKSDVKEKITVEGAFNMQIGDSDVKSGLITNPDNKIQYSFAKNENLKLLDDLAKKSPGSKYAVTGNWGKTSNGRNVAELTQAPTLVKK